MKTTNHYSLNLFVILFFLSFNICFAQEYHGTVTSPSYEGGLTALQKFISQNTNHPNGSGNDSVLAIVTLSYTINQKGQVENIKILRGVDNACDAEAVRVAQLINGWHAAVQWGKPVSTKIIMPIEFYCENQETKSPFNVKGHVYDNGTGTPVEGSLVLVKGTNEGAITDKDGYYTVSVSDEECVLEFSSLGYEIKTETIGKNRTINVELRTDDLSIDFINNRFN